MSDYTVKREKEGILRIQAEGTKMPGPLTINERDYADDKQLIVGGGSSSPLGLAKAKFVTNNTSITFGSCFAYFIGLPAYMPASEGYAETSNVYGSDNTLEEWNADVDDGNAFLITPCCLYTKDSSEVTYTLEGNAEFESNIGDNYIKITGDCTITIEVLNQSAI